MSNLNIRNLPDEVYAALRLRAAKAGRSMQAEARATLAAAYTPGAAVTSRELAEWVRAQYAGQPPVGVVDELIAERRRESATE